MSGSGLWAAISRATAGTQPIFTNTVTRVHRPQVCPARFLDMAPVFKVHEQSTAIMERRKGKRKVDDLNEDLEEGDVPPGPANNSPPKKKRNKQRVLMLSSRGITHRMRHFMNDLEALLPHVKKGVCVKLSPVHSRMLC